MGTSNHAAATIHLPGRPRLEPVWSTLASLRLLGTSHTRRSLPLHCSVAPPRSWAKRESNPRPPACKAGALDQLSYSPGSSPYNASPSGKSTQYPKTKSTGANPVEPFANRRYPATRHITAAISKTALARLKRSRPDSARFSGTMFERNASARVRQGSTAQPTSSAFFLSW